MNKIPQISRRRIGSVTIIDLKGELIGPWALKAKDSLNALISNIGSENLLINLKELETIDSLGVKAIMENFPTHVKSGLISGRNSVMEMFQRLGNEGAVQVFNSEEEVINHFGEDLMTESQFTPFPEQRHAQRLKTAVPLEFWYEDESGDKITFRAIVTDLSESGLFAEYLDVESLSDFNKYLNPRELNELHMKMKLPDQDHLFIEGKVTRTVITGEQVGVGVAFVDLKDSDKKCIKEFLEV